MNVAEPAWEMVLQPLKQRAVTEGDLLHLPEELEVGSETLMPGYYLMTTRFSRWPQALTLVALVGEDDDGGDLVVCGPEVSIADAALDRFRVVPAVVGFTGS